MVFKRNDNKTRLLSILSMVFRGFTLCAIKIPIVSGRVSIRIHRDIEGKMWFGVG